MHHKILINMLPWKVSIGKLDNSYGIIFIRWYVQDIDIVKYQHGNH